MPLSRTLALLTATAVTATLVVGLADTAAIGDTTTAPAAAATAGGSTAGGSSGVPPESEDPTTGTTPADTPVDLTVVLRPADQTALRGLPTDTAGASSADRSDAVAEVAPAAQPRDVVRAALQASGFTVTDLDTWELEATGTAGSASALFGVRLLGTGDGMHPDGTVVLPASFQGAVSAVLGLDTRPVASHAAIPAGYTPADVAGAYGANAAATAGAGTTVATVQFSGWDRNDLTAYAVAAGRPVPAVDQIAVDGANVHAVDGSGGETEVALDQEALLATAPAARQRIYVAPNSFQGTYDTYSRIADDVQAQHITAVSISWGFCESQASADVRSVLDDALDRIVAAGATVFAASGDDGANCPVSDTKSIRDVSYPASSLAVVGVGGTSVTRSGSTWRETGWSNTLGAGGGGTSSYDKPAWQTGTGVSGTKRLVPDIASIADPNRGLGVYLGAAHGFALGGGTSLASPVVAGQLAAALSTRSCTDGVGDVHAALYANPTAFRDVTSGSNGTFPATTGYDLATGLGTPDWSRLAAAIPVPASCTDATGTAAGAGSAVSATTITGSASLVPSGTSIHSPSGQYWLDMQADGNLVEWGNGRALWSTATKSAGSSLAVGTDGSVSVVSTAGVVQWRAGGSIGAGGTPVLQVTDRGDVQIVQGTAVRWHNSRPGADTMVAGSALVGGQTVWDSTSTRRVWLGASNGQVRIYGGSKLLRSISGGGAGSTLRLQSDGNLVLYDALGRAKWSTGTWRYGGSGMTLRMQSDGNLVLRKGTTVRWQSKTHG